MELAREETHEVPLTIVDVTGILQGCIGRVQRRRPDVKFELRPTTWTMEGDSFGLNRALLNLLDNAAKWSPSNGTVRIDMVPGDRELELRVSDSGPEFQWKSASEYLTASTDPSRLVRCRGLG